MEIETCRQCGKVFMKRTSVLCPDCARRGEDDFLAIRGYLDEHPGATMMTLCDALGVAEETVSRLIEEGRLVMSGGQRHRCESCGEEVQFGQKLCLRCRVQLDQSLRSAANVLRSSLKEGSASDAGKGSYYTRRDRD